MTVVVLFSTIDDGYGPYMGILNPNSVLIGIDTVELLLDPYIREFVRGNPNIHNRILIEAVQTGGNIVFPTRPMVNEDSYCMVVYSVGDIPNLVRHAYSWGVPPENLHNQLQVVHNHLNAVDAFDLRTRLPI